MGKALVGWDGAELDAGGGGGVGGWVVPSTWGGVRMSL